MEELEVIIRELLEKDNIDELDSTFEKLKIF